MAGKTAGWVAAGLALGLMIWLAGCPTGSEPRSTARITIVDIPQSPGSGVTYLILGAGDAGGAAARDKNLNPNPLGTPVPWTGIEDGRAVIDLYDGPGFTAYLSALRYGYPLPPVPVRRAISGSGQVTVTYFEMPSNAASTGPASGTNPDKMKIWGTGGVPVKFNGDIILRWTDGKSVIP